MTTTTPKFQTSSRHTAFGFAVIAALWLSLTAGFVAHASTTRSAGPELRASTTVSSVQHAS